MKGIKILHCADLHIGAAHSSLGAQARERSAELKQTLGVITDECRNEGIRLLLIAGDLFDRNTAPAETVDTVCRYFRAIPDTFVAIVPGNHDFLSADSPYMQDFPDNVHIFRESESITVDGITIHGIPFTSVYSDTFALPAANGINILLMHADINGGPYNPVTEQLLASSGMDYIALGHVHKFSGINKAGRVTWAYPGSPEPLGFDETGEKGVIIGSIDETGCHLDFKPLSRRQYKELRLDVSDAEDMGEVEAAARRLLSEEGNNLIKLIFEGRTDLKIDTAFLQSSLQPLCYFLKVRNRTNPAVNLDILKNEPSLKGVFVKKMLERYDCAAEEDKEKILSAMNIGLSAFERKEVAFDEN